MSCVPSIGPAAWIFLSVCFGLVACAEDEKPRPNGATCSSVGQCNSGLCLSQTCLAPELDDDLDGLLNSVEGALGNDPLRADTDGDGSITFTAV
ncbi:MAG: hypothetical protein ACI9MR_003636 [Myxococcota bacterium]|jgi:hypothetical protein